MKYRDKTISLCDIKHMYRLASSQSVTERILIEIQHCEYCAT